jgi:hypothetical protein
MLLHYSAAPFQSSDAQRKATVHSVAMARLRNILVKFEGRTVMADNVFEEVSEIDCKCELKKINDQFTKKLRTELPKKQPTNQQADSIAL